MGTILSRIALPGQDRTELIPLYYHADGPVSREDGQLVIAAGSRVTFDSYFNGFFYEKYRTYTHVTEVSLHIEMSGRGRAGILLCTADGERTLAEERFSGGRTGLPPVSLEGLPAEGMLCLRLLAEDGPVLFRRGWYETGLAPVNEVKAAAVICTYKREAYVKRSLEQMRKTVWEDGSSPIRDALDAFVVDNGQTLELAEEPHVHLFPNKNCGGSGGFTRGLIEVRRRGDTYSHVLFMDDDITFETETLVKTIQLLRYARRTERPLCIGGQMLMEETPAVQFEAGLVMKNGRAVSLDHGAELSRREALLANGTGQEARYSGWYYYCQPADVADKFGLPFPFFIKDDDTEYCLRTEPHLLLMNGIGVWHRGFAEKYSVHLEYYIKRNELVVSALYGGVAGVWSNLWKLLRASGKSVLAGDPRRIDFMIRAYRDYLKGPEFFLKTDGEVLNAELLEELKKPAGSRAASVIAAPFRLLPVAAAFIRGHRKAESAYRVRLGELTGLAFWRKYLGLEEREGEHEEAT